MKELDSTCGNLKLKTLFNLVQKENHFKFRRNFSQTTSCMALKGKPPSQRRAVDTAFSTGRTARGPEQLLPRSLSEGGRPCFCHPHSLGDRETHAPTQREASRSLGPEGRRLSREDWRLREARAGGKTCGQSGCLCGGDSPRPSGTLSCSHGCS